MPSASLDQLTNDAYRCFNAQDIDQAELICNTILQQQREHFDALHCLGLIHFQRGQLDQAVIAFTRGLEHRQDSDLYSNLGLTLSKLGHLDEALACFVAAISLNPNNASAFYNQGNLLQLQNQLEDALGKAARADGLVFIEIHTGRLDCAESLRSAGRSMAKTNQLD